MFKFFNYSLLSQQYLSFSLFLYCNQAVEEHAVETYTTFLKDFEDELKSTKPCKVAKEYYLCDETQMYLFDEMHICAGNKPGQDNLKNIGVSKRRPKMDNLYDVFVAIRNDELEHVKTMNFLQQKEADIQICNIE